MYRGDREQAEMAFARAGHGRTGTSAGTERTVLEAVAER